MLPLILCWGVTVHKLQGCTLNEAVIDVGRRIFAQGQVYVALSKVLPGLGCDTEVKKDILIQEIIQEINRRHELIKRASERKKLISKNYIPVHHEVYKIQESFFDESFLTLVLIAKTGDYSEVLKSLDVISKEKKLYGFKVFTEEFCLKLLEELNNYENSNLPKERPNTMNKYGILLDDLGFSNYFSRVLRTNYLDPLAKILFPEWRREELDSHKIFTVAYKVGQDLDLGAHYDNSEVTLNVCLGKCFEGGELYFGDLRQEEQSTYIEYAHKIGYGILHRGQQIHGALPITSGERCNLIVWMRSSSVRNKICPMCDSKPNLCPTDDYGDGFTEVKEVETCCLN